VSWNVFLWNMVWKRCLGDSSSSPLIRHQLYFEYKPQQYDCWFTLSDYAQTWRLLVVWIEYHQICMWNFGMAVSFKVRKCKSWLLQLLEIASDAKSGYKSWFLKQDGTSTALDNWPAKTTSKKKILEMQYFFLSERENRKSSVQNVSSLFKIHNNSVKLFQHSTSKYTTAWRPRHSCYIAVFLQTIYIQIAYNQVWKEESTLHIIPIKKPRSK
jgi:hypothetical protein